MVNENRPGIYKVFKRIGFDGNRLDQDWFMSAEFLLDDKMQVRETDSSDSNIHADRHPEYPGGITALNPGIRRGKPTKMKWAWPIVFRLPQGN